MGALVHLVFFNAFMNMQKKAGISHHIYVDRVIFSWYTKTYCLQREFYYRIQVILIVFCTWCFIEFSIKTLIKLQ